MAKSVRYETSPPLNHESSLTNTPHKQIINKHYRRILTQWPPDLLRPEISFQKALRRRLEARLNPPPTASPAENVGSDHAQATAPTKVAFDEKGELEQVNVLYSFLENRYMKQVRAYGRSCVSILLY